MKKNNKGFTLAELLIVVAIIAVLVAIAIPVFTTQLEKSREATDVANVRSAYATLMADYLQNTASKSTTVTALQKTSTWETSPDPKLKTMIDGVEGSVTIPAKTSNYKIAVGADGKVTIS
ncbi:MAG: prepilin-type N-terminal cleavage/methylation domain-containing protein [Clostridia bacterium]|nr:prepilin-type N-terminal cleavage/methylation domain-containing protein [Clostridia bacterium]